MNRLENLVEKAQRLIEVTITISGIPNDPRVPNDIKDAAERYGATIAGKNAYSFDNTSDAYGFQKDLAKSWSQLRFKQDEAGNPIKNFGGKKAPPFKKDEGPSLLIAGIILSCLEDLEEELNDEGFQLKDGIRAKVTPILTSGIESIVGPEGE